MSRENGHPPLVGQWYACQFPEREPNGSAVFAGNCRACVLAAITHLRRRGDHVGDGWNSDTGQSVMWDERFSSWVAGWAAEHGLQVSP